MDDVQWARRELMRDSPAVEATMSDRLVHIKVLKQFWEVNDIHGAALYLTRVDDLAVAVDFFNGLGETGLAGTKSSPDLSLDCCHLFAPFVNRLLDSVFADYVLTALKTGVAMLRTVSDTIKSTGSWARDLQSAGRRAKCESCYDEFMKIRDKVAPLTGADAPVGPAAVRFAEQLESLGAAARELRQQSRQE